MEKKKTELSPAARMWIGPIFGFFALILSLVGSFRCDYIDLIVTTGATTTYKMGFGIWFYQGYKATENKIYFINQCFEYVGDNTALDSYWKGAASFSVISVVFGFFIVAASCIAPCAKKYQCSKTYAYLYLFVTLCNGLCLLFLRSNLCKNNPFVARIPALDTVDGDACQLATGAACSIAATMIWCLAAAFMWYSWYKETKELPDWDDDEELAAKDDDMSSKEMAENDDDMSAGMSKTFGRRRSRSSGRVMPEFT